MNNIYFDELIKLAEDFEKFWHKKYYETHCKGRRIYKNFNDYYQKIMEEKQKDFEKYNDPEREVSEERRQIIKDSIINETTIRKDGLDFIIFTYKTKRYKDIKSLSDILSTDYSAKSHVVYNTSVIIHYEEKIGGTINARDVENLFFSIAKTKPKAIKNFEQTCNMINNSTMEELMDKIRNHIKESKETWKQRFEEDKEKTKKVKENI